MQVEPPAQRLGEGGQRSETVIPDAHVPILKQNDVDKTICPF
jgi:hypothetical protein